MREIVIQTIPQSEQRYCTVGDWIYDDLIKIRVSDLGNAKIEFLVALHELIEMYLCLERGISVEAVDQFDMHWNGKGEPGDDPLSPYYKEHQFASVIERMMAHELGIDWQAYCKTLDEIA